VGGWLKIINLRTRFAGKSKCFKVVKLSPELH